MTEPIPIQEIHNFIGQTLNYEYKDDEGKQESGIIVLRKVTPSYVFGYVKTRNSYVEFLNSKKVNFYPVDEKPQ